MKEESALPLLQTRSLMKSFGGVHAIRGVDFRINTGELRCIVGPNGAGKSTFFKLISGQLKPSGGIVQFNGQEISKLHLYEVSRLGIGIKNQTPDVFDSLTVEQSLRLATGRAEAPDLLSDHVATGIEKFDLRSVWGVKIGELSHGKRQWIEIAVVVARRPKLLLLDEPTAGMSPGERVTLAEFLKGLASLTTIVVVEHDMEFVRRIATSVTVFHQGSLFLEGDTEVVFKDERVRDIYLGREAA